LLIYLRHNAGVKDRILLLFDKEAKKAAAATAEALGAQEEEEEEAAAGGEEAAAEGPDKVPKEQLRDALASDTFRELSERVGAEGGEEAVEKGKLEELVNVWIGDEGVKAWMEEAIRVRVRGRGGRGVDGGGVFLRGFHLQWVFVRWWCFSRVGSQFCTHTLACLRA